MIIKYYLSILMAVSVTAHAQKVVPVVGYTEPTKVFFQGEAIGDGAGILNLTTSTGHRCSGNWYYKTINQGYAEANCTDGRVFSVDFYAQDPLSGTSISKGRSSFGEDIVAYAGLNATRFLQTRPEKPKEKAVAFGTGFFVGRKGHVVTNHHVVEGCSQIYINHKDKTVKADLVNFNKDLDLAVVNSGINSEKPAKISIDFRVGESVYAVGYPLAGRSEPDIVFQSGMIAASNGYQGVQHQLQHSAPLNPGNSGGPLLNAYAQIVGVNVSVLAANQNNKIYSQQYYAIKNSSLTEFLKRSIDFDQSFISMPDKSRKFDPETIFSIASGFTVKITCLRDA